ncbi:MAG: hypothetical protein LC797_09975, partial [Chloroflexi bacterium]|nr:hypothetical protein [Chloroflexota bacterium]
MFAPMILWIVMQTNVTPAVLLVTRDPEVRVVRSTLQDEGFTFCSVSSIHELDEALGKYRSHCVAVIDRELASDPTFPMADFLERLRAVPL